MSYTETDEYKLRRMADDLLTYAEACNDAVARS